MFIRLLFFLLLLFPASVFAEKLNDDLEILQARAIEKRLWETKAWLDLGHYKRTLLGGYKSLIDSPGFFLAPTGKTSPRDELLTSISQIFSGDKYCTYPARAHWLKSQLSLTDDRFDDASCAEFSDWLSKIKPAGLTLVFPDAYINNPSSMFGHTLLRIDQPAGQDDTRLSSYVVNFAAQTDESNGLIFAVKGLTGGYPGAFSILPYYKKVKEYSDMESRDIWEYRLNFNLEEIVQMLRHVWELDKVTFDYYFFDENCSYHLLSLLEVARPGLDLTNRFFTHAIPTDTIRSVIVYEGIVENYTYRPSSRTLIRHQAKALPRQAVDTMLSITNGKEKSWQGEIALDDYDAEQRARILDLAYEYLQYRYYEEKNIQRTVHVENVRRVLSARSKIDVQAINYDVNAPATRPEQGHATARFGIGVGHHERRDFVELSFKPAYHDILDYSAGYFDGSQINMFDLTLRYDDTEEQVEIERLDLVNILSLPVRDELFSPMAFRVQAGLSRLPYPGNRNGEHLYFEMQGGAGATYSLSSTQFFTAMLEADLQVHNAMHAGYGFAAGPAFYWLWAPLQRVNVLASVAGMKYVTTPDDVFVDHSLQVNFSLSTDSAVRFGWSRFGVHDDPDQTVRLNWFVYF